MKLGMMLRPVILFLLQPPTASRARLPRVSAALLDQRAPWTR